MIMTREQAPQVPVLFILNQSFLFHDRFPNR